MKNSQTSNSIEDIFGSVIHEDSFNTRIQSGEYMDVIDTISLNQLAKEAGIKFAVAVDAGMFSAIKNFSPALCQSVSGRVWDLFTMFTNAAKGRISAKVEQLECGQAMTFDFIMTQGRSKWVTVKAIVGPKGPHDAAPCISFHFVR
jgi:hypothetical protein